MEDLMDFVDWVEAGSLDADENGEGTEEEDE